jgi:molybdopterin adenylyltransferase
MSEKIKVAILTVSDRSSCGEREDLSGPAIRDALGKIDHEVIWYGVVPDDPDQIKNALIDLADNKRADVVLTTGGTGLSPRDHTPEATLEAGERKVPGIAEMLRARSGEVTPHAMLSRGVSVTRGSTLIVNFPGSPKACRECTEFLIPALPHAVRVLRGEVTDCGKESAHGKEEATSA